MFRWDRFLDWLLGAKCGRCSVRVFPADQRTHMKDCGV